MSRPVVIAGSGSPRYILPGFAVAQELTTMGVGVRWLGDDAGLGLLGPHGVPFTPLPLVGDSPRGAAQVLAAATKLPLAVARTARFLLHVDPIAVLAVGGLASIAGILAAGLTGVPVVLQEQSAYPRWSSRVLAPWVDLICTGFAETAACHRSLSTEWTGTPVRPELFAVPPIKLASPPRLLVLGGSKGSLFLNRTMPRAAASLHRRGLPVAVLHQAGAAWSEVVRAAYRDLGVEATVEAFLPEPWNELAECDLVVSRVGVLTLAELMAAGRPAVLLPFGEPDLPGQEQNARALERAGAAVVIPHARATAERVAEVLQELLDDHDRLRTMAERARSNALPDAARRIAERLLAIGGER